MSQQNDSKDFSNVTDAKGEKIASHTAKKPYQAPAWEVEDVFEKMALTCNKADDSCAAGGPIQS